MNVENFFLEFTNFFRKIKNLIKIKYVFKNYVN